MNKYIHKYFIFIIMAASPQFPNNKKGTPPENLCLLTVSTKTFPIFVQPILILSLVFRFDKSNKILWRKYVHSIHATISTTSTEIL